MRVHVGSENPVKIRATERALARMAPWSEFEVVGVEVDPGVPEQPVGWEEVYEGARNRALRALELGADLGVGIEAGIVEVGGKNLDVHVAVVADGEREGVGLSPGFQPPEDVEERALEREPVGEVASRELGVTDIGRGAGLIGVLTRGAVLRDDLCELAVIMALVGGGFASWPPEDRRTRS
ncbi:MAG: inosine/xanthosine triphosphatase [Methanopyri archaeon]|nr:inosine/xanthosine triphosphatase [Methanopyri archaeon]